MQTVRLAGLTPENWERCADLRVAEGQEDYVDTNLFCIAESKIEPSWLPFAVYAAEEMVGMTVYGKVRAGVYEIHHLMIAGDHQRRGYGRAAMREILRRIRADRDCGHVELTYWPPNPAVRLYRDLGFEHTGEVRDDEPVMRLTLSR